MIYAISDIHGEYDKYLSLLKKIQFSSSDELYIVGDVIDRHPGGVDILLDIMNRNNVHLIKGNHEEMCIHTLGPVNVFGARQLWVANGGANTRRELLYHRTTAERHAILRFLDNLPYFAEVSAGGNDFYLVHGYPVELGEGDGPLWSRISADSKNPIPGKIVIVGHTPVPYLTGKFDEPYRIWHADGILDIDCGCGNSTPMRSLACIRLDDLEEFYI